MERRAELTFQQERESHYLYLKPESLLSSEEQDAAKQTSVAHVGPLWKEYLRQMVGKVPRTYGGAEDVVMNTLNGLTYFNIKYQEVFGNPRNKGLEYVLPHLRVHYPSFSEYTKLDLYETLMKNQANARDLERGYVFGAYQEILGLKGLDIAHDHTNYGKDIGYFASDYLPVVRTEHGPLEVPDNHAIDAFHFDHFTNERISMLKERNSQWFIAISESQLSEKPDLPWIAVVHNGIDPADFDYSTDKKDYLLYFGRISREKSPHRAIEVAQALNMPLKLVGHVTPESETYFNEEIKEKIKGKIEYIPGAGVEERRKYFAEASAFLVLGEWREPFGLVTAEAMMSGTPVVGFNRGGIPEVIEHNKTGYVVDEVDEAIDATFEVLRGKIDPAACRERAEKYFSAEVMSAKLFQVYLEAIKRFKGQSQEKGRIF